MITPVPLEMKKQKSSCQKFFNFLISILALGILTAIGITAYKYAINAYNEASALISPLKPEKPIKPVQVPRGYTSAEPPTVEPMTILVEKEDICAGFDIPENPTVDEFIKELAVLEKITEDDDKELNRIDCYFERNVDPNFADSDGDSPIFFAIAHWMLPVIKRMHKVSKIDFTRTNKTGSTVMHLAVAAIPKDKDEIEKMKNVITYLVAIDGNVDVLSESGYTPLMAAIESENIEATRMLLEDFSANPNSVAETFKMSPLILAVEKKNIKILKLLLKYQANVLAVNENGDTAFHLAAGKGFTSGLQTMLTTVKGLNVNAINPKGDTALHYAVWNDKVEVVKYLLYQAFADYQIANKENLKAYHCTAKKPEILKLFVNFEEQKIEHDKAILDEVSNRAAKAIGTRRAINDKKRSFERESKALDLQEETLMDEVHRGCRPKKVLDDFLEMRAKKEQELKDFIAARTTETNSEDENDK